MQVYVLPTLGKFNWHDSVIDECRGVSSKALSRAWRDTVRLRLWIRDTVPTYKMMLTITIYWASFSLNGGHYLGFIFQMNFINSLHRIFVIKFKHPICLSKIYAGWNNVVRYSIAVFIKAISISDNS